MKGILKIIYIVVGVIATILVYVLGYNSNCVNHIVNLTNEAIAEKDYVQLAKIHGGCFDVNNLAVENDDLLTLIIRKKVRRTLSKLILMIRHIIFM